MAVGIQPHGISSAALDRIVEFEVSSEAAYNKSYRRPTWPPCASGVTIGIGDDCGYSTGAQIRSDWGGLLPAAKVAALVSVAGMTGARAQAALSSVKNAVDVPWSAVLAVFSNTPLPKYVALVAKLANNRISSILNRFQTNASTSSITLVMRNLNPKWL